MINKFLARLANCLALLIFFALTPTTVQAETACECYQSGVSGYSRPTGCTRHFMGPMTPHLGGYYDAKDGNTKYLDSNDWCSSGGSSSSGSASGSGSGNSGSGNFSSNPSEGAWHVMLAKRHNGSICPMSDYDDGTYCWGSCLDGFTPAFGSPIGNICYECPAGTTSVQMHGNGLIECFR